MHIAELIEIALANSDDRRVEMVALEPSEIAVEAVSGLAQLISELVDNAVAFSENGDKVRVTGLFDQGSYLITISDRGIGIPEHLMNALNRALDDPTRISGPEPRLGIALIARLAARHGIKVRLVPGVPGTTARVTVPSRLVTATESGPEPATAKMDVSPPANDREVSRKLRARAEQEYAPAAPGAGDTVAFDKRERGFGTGSGVVAMSEEARRQAEEFLEKVFAPLARQPGMTERPPGRAASNGNRTGRETSSGPARPPVQGNTGATVTTLRTRVPGENYSPVEDDPSTVAAERAVDIRSALSKYSEGRKSAEEARRDGSATPGA
jgi:anti-sigma regulatory factor (Ser/Thr protein kinase)